MSLQLNDLLFRLPCACPEILTNFSRVAVTMNIVGAQRMLTLAHQMSRLEAFVHVSTAYANCDRLFIKEKVYRMSVHPQKLIDAAR